MHSLNEFWSPEFMVAVFGSLRSLIGVLLLRPRRQRGHFGAEKTNQQHVNT